MKTLIEKLKALSTYTVISSAFKHDCWMNKKMVSSSYFKDGDSGVMFSTGKEYCCEKCGKRWSE
jgi:hypothetical protein